MTIIYIENKYSIPDNDTLLIKVKETSLPSHMSHRVAVIAILVALR